MIVARSATPEDVPDLARVGLASWQKGIAPLVATEVAWQFQANSPFLPFLTEHGETVLAAEVDGVLAGFAACEHGDSHISDVWVAPEYEGRGVATLLIQSLERQFSARGFLKSTISVLASNARALSLYLHLGYGETWRGLEADPTLGLTVQKVVLLKSLRAKII